MPFQSNNGDLKFHSWQFYERKIAEQKAFILENAKNLTPFELAGLLDSLLNLAVLKDGLWRCFLYWQKHGDKKNENDHCRQQINQEPGSGGTSS